MTAIPIINRNVPQPMHPAPSGRESFSNLRGGADGRDPSDASVRLKN